MGPSWGEAEWCEDVGVPCVQSGLSGGDSYRFRLAGLGSHVLPFDPKKKGLRYMLSWCKRTKPHLYIDIDQFMIWNITKDFQDQRESCCGATAVIRNHQHTADHIQPIQRKRRGAKLHFVSNWNYISKVRSILLHLLVDHNSISCLFPRFLRGLVLLFL